MVASSVQLQRTVCSTVRWWLLHVWVRVTVWTLTGLAALGGLGVAGQAVVVAWPKSPPVVVATTVATATVTAAPLVVQDATWDAARVRLAAAVTVAQEAAAAHPDAPGRGALSRAIETARTAQEAAGSTPARVLDEIAASLEVEAAAF